MFIQTEDTPNPETMKFLPGREVSPTTPFEFTSEAESQSSPMAASLFLLKGVKTVFLGADFVAVTKSPETDWSVLKPQVLAAIMDLYVSGLPVIDLGAQTSTPDEAVYEGETAEIVAEIKELIEKRVRPAVANDGGDIVFEKFDAETGVVTLHMRGACAGCPSSTITLKSGIENMLRHYVPEVTAVEAAL